MLESPLSRTIGLHSKLRTVADTSTKRTPNLFDTRKSLLQSNNVGSEILAVGSRPLVRAGPVEFVVAAIAIMTPNETTSFMSDANRLPVGHDDTGYGEGTPIRTFSLNVYVAKQFAPSALAFPNKHNSFRRLRSTQGICLF